MANNNDNTKKIALNIITVISFVSLVFEFSLVMSEIFGYNLNITIQNITTLPTNEYSFLMFLSIFTMSSLGLHWGKIHRNYNKSQNKYAKFKGPPKRIAMFVNHKK